MDQQLEPLPRVFLRDRARLERELAYRYPVCTSDRQRAIRLRVSPSTYKRIAEGTMAPGNQFIASVLVALPGTRFERWFVTEPQPGPALKHAG